MAMTEQRLLTLEEFWPYYVQEHAHPRTRQLHFIGNVNLILWLILAFLRRDWKLIVTAVVTSYAFAWYGHFVVEENEPATFKYPLMAGLCNLMMFGQQLRGAMQAEVDKYVNTSSRNATGGDLRFNRSPP